MKKTTCCQSIWYRDRSTQDMCWKKLVKKLVKRGQPHSIEDCLMGRIEMLDRTVK